MGNFNDMNPRRARKAWEGCGGSVVHVRRTGEERWVHPAFDGSIRTNSRRHDIPMAVLSRLNKLLG